MSALDEIEAAVDALPAEQKQELLVYLTTRLRAQNGPVPEPRKFAPEQISAWIEEDQADMRHFREGT